FRQIASGGGVIQAIVVPGGNSYTRSQIDVLVDQAKQIGFSGLIWVRPGEPPVSSVKALGEATLRAALERTSASTGDLLLMSGGVPETTDRKSTRLNSSHLGISYAVSCSK